MHRKTVAVSVATAFGLILLTTGATSAGAAPRATTDSAVHSYIVQATTEDGAATAVTAVGGTVVAPLAIVGGVDAKLDSSALAELSVDAAVHITPDVVLHSVGTNYSASTQADQLARMDLPQNGSSNAGAGIGVALIDTGVANTPGITASHLVRSPDFSGQNDVYDGYGHGTFMAGLIAGNGTGGPGAVAGVAPGATLVSVKVAGADGTTTMAELIEGIGWSIAHRDAYNIRVMSISFGADLSLAPSADPLDAAVEAAWASGITVVAAAGNGGAGDVTSPGDDPWVITVGAETTTGPVSSPSWSGSSASKPDVLAPGVSVTSLRDPGSVIDLANPGARVGSLYFKGSGTSMATALTAGAAVLLVAAHPDATPDDIKGALIAASGTPLVGHAGPIDVAAADAATPSPSWWQTHPIALNGFGGQLGNRMPWALAPWTSMSWGSMSWGSMSWGSMSWGSMSWGSMSWGSMSWGSMSWGSMSWGSMSWGSMSWGSMSWS